MGGRSRNTPPIATASSTGPSKLKFATHMGATTTHNHRLTNPPGHTPPSRAQVVEEAAPHRKQGPAKAHTHKTSTTTTCPSKSASPCPKGVVMLSYSLKYILLLALLLAPVASDCIPGTSGVCTCGWCILFVARPLEIILPVRPHLGMPSMSAVGMPSLSLLPVLETLWAAQPHYTNRNVPPLRVPSLLSLTINPYQTPPQAEQPRQTLPPSFEEATRTTRTLRTLLMESRSRGVPCQSPWKSARNNAKPIYPSESPSVLASAMERNG